MKQRPETSGNEWIRRLISENESKLILYACRLLGGDIHRARDVVQDTFLKLCRADRARIENHAVGWLFTVCRNRCFEVRRKEKRMVSVEEAAMEVIHSGTEQPSARMEQEEDLDHVRIAVNSLPEQQQEIVRLKFQNGMSYREISRVMDISVSNVGVTLHNAIKAIRKRLNLEPAMRQVEG